MTSSYKRILRHAFIGLVAASWFGLCSAQQSSPSTVAETPKIAKTKIALILSPKGSVLAQATAPIREGIFAASQEARESGTCELIEYSLSNPAEASEVLKKAAEDGALLAIGPVSRNEVQAIAEMPYLPLPVVAINRPTSGRTPDLFLSIDISAESEADQLAKIAVENTSHRTELTSNNFVILSTGDPYDERLARSMEEALVKAGAGAERRHVTQDQIAYLRQEMRGKAFRGIFFAMSAANASLLRPYLPPELPIFGTSYTNPMRQKDSMQAKTQSNDLSGMVTLEIPAERQGSSLVSEFKRAHQGAGEEEIQMFSVGVDAWSLGTQWIDWRQHIDIPDGLSGKLSFNKTEDGKVVRELNKVVVTPRDAGNTSDEDLVQFTESAEEAGL